jgi:acyl-CoA synthetase (AMP-forming)/AMP-acid ligase II
MLILDALQQHVKEQPHKVLYHWLDEHGEIEKTVTFADLWQFSTVVAEGLSKKYGLKRGDRAMIVFPFGVEFMTALIACFRIGVVAVSVYPPNPNKLSVDIDKFAHFVKDSDSYVALSTSQYRNIVYASRIQHWNWPKDLKWIAIDKIAQTSDVTRLQIKDACYYPDLSPDDLAFIQYTSGSTREPKGVMITHGNIAHQLKFCEMAAVMLDLDPQQFVSLNWVPQYHDMGLFIAYLYPIFVGFTSYTMSPLTFLRNPIIWPLCIEKYSANATIAPNFAYQLACKRLESSGLKVNCGCLRFCTLGAEPAQFETYAMLNRVMNVSLNSIFTFYGLAEFSLAAGGGR